MKKGRKHPTVDHTALPFDELIEQEVHPNDFRGRTGCRVMQDGWDIGFWIETHHEGAGPVAKKILAVNDLLDACRAIDEWHDLVAQDYPEMLGPFKKARAALIKAGAPSNKPPLTVNQLSVLHELRRRGAEWIAGAAERHWRSGEEYYIDERVGVSQRLRRRFLKGNQEALRSRGDNPT